MFLKLIDDFIIQAFPDTVFHLGNESTVLSDLDHMAHAGKNSIKFG
jgi:hypothetical protein